MRTVLHTESSPGLGGQEIRTLNEARWIGERGWRVIVAGQPDGRFVTRAREAGLETVAVRMRSPWDLAAVGAPRRGSSAAEGVSVVHTHSSVDGWLGGLAARAARVPVVRTRHVSIPVRRRLQSRLHVARGPRHHERRGDPADHRGRGRAAGARRRDPRRRRPRVACRFARARRRPLRDLRLSSPVIGSVAMFRGSKGHAQLLEAFAAVRAASSHRHAPPRGRRHPPGLGGGARARGGLADHVVFTGFRADVPALLATMDCFVLASTRTEGVPQSLLQAFAAGVPVVASDIGGMPEVVAEGVTGLLAASGSAAALAAGIERVLADPPGAMRRAETAARALVEARFSHAASVARLLAALRRARGCRRADPSARGMKEGRPLVVLHLVANRWWTGSADPVIRLVRGLRERGHRVLLGLVPGARFEDKAREAGIAPVPGLSLDARVDLRALLRDVRRLRRLTRAEGIDVVHCHHSHDHWLGRLCRGPAALVRTFHNARSVSRGLAGPRALPTDRWRGRGERRDRAALPRCGRGAGARSFASTASSTSTRFAKGGGAEHDPPGARARLGAGDRLRGAPRRRTAATSS